MNVAEEVRVIRTVCRIGDGTPDDPMRMVVSYWTLDGKLIAEMSVNDDPYSPQTNPIEISGHEIYQAIMRGVNTAINRVHAATDDNSEE